MGETPKTQLDRVAERVYRDHDGYWLDEHERRVARWVIDAVVQLAVEDLNSQFPRVGGVS